MGAPTLKCVSAWQALWHSLKRHEAIECVLGSPCGAQSACLGEGVGSGAVQYLGTGRFQYTAAIHAHDEQLVRVAASTVVDRSSVVPRFIMCHSRRVAVSVWWW